MDFNKRLLWEYEVTKGDKMSSFDDYIKDDKMSSINDFIEKYVKTNIKHLSYEALFYNNIIKLQSMIINGRHSFKVFKTITRNCYHHVFHVLSLLS